jgi:hypothetical protein
MMDNIQILEHIASTHIDTYADDGRASLDTLYKRYLLLSQKDKMPHGLEKFIINTFYFGNPSESFRTTECQNLPIFTLENRATGMAVYLIAGIHGEEPAGPIAIANMVEKIRTFDFPIIILPVANPWGYKNNWRLINAASEDYDGATIWGAEHHMAHPEIPDRPWFNTPICHQALTFTTHLLKLSRKYAPVLVIDLHENHTDNASYVYSHGRSGIDDPVALAVERIIAKNAPPFNGHANIEGSNAQIINGIIAIRDGSATCMMAEKRIYSNKRWISGPNTQSVIVAETDAKLPLTERVQRHESVIAQIPELRRLALEAKGKMPHIRKQL